MVSIRWYLGYLKGYLGGAGVGCCLSEVDPLVPYYGPQFDMDQIREAHRMFSGVVAWPAVAPSSFKVQRQWPD